jgi:hypothetical protein
LILPARKVCTGNLHRAIELGRPDWRVDIYRGGDDPDLRVVDRIEAEDTDHGLTVLVVE